MALSHDQGPSVLSALETIDKPIYSSHYAPETISQDTPKGRPVPVARISTLPPLPTLPYAGPSTGPQRYLFVAVRRGHNKGVYASWPEAQRQIADHPSPVFKTFSTRFAAEAFVLGWNGSGRHCLPASSPKPLREHLAMTFPSAVSAQPPSTSTRTPYHIKMLSSSPPVESTWTTSIVGGDFAPGYLNASASRTSTYRHSLVKVSSPLRSQVDGEAADAPSIRPADAPSIRPSIRKATSMIGIGGLLSPPASPEDPLGHVHPPPVQTLPSRPESLRAKSECGSTGSHKQFPAVDMGLGLSSPPNSPPSAPVKRPSMASLRSSQSYSGLWADSKPVTSSSLSRSPLPSPSIIEADTPTLNAPKFSRSGLKKSGVIMPAAAPRTNSSTSSLTLNRGSSRSSLSPSPSMTSLNSVSSRKGSGSRPVSTRTDSQDRLASLAETSRRELKLNEEGLLALQSLSPPRPAFMVRRSGSNSSLSSLTSVSSASSSLVQPGSIPEDEEWDMGRRGSSGLGVHVADELVISCTKSDADADGSVESSSMKSGAGGKSGKKKGGLFRRLGQALKLEKKQPAAGAAGRRPSA